MNTYLKLASIKPNNNCNCISPFYIDNINGINPNTGKEYTSEDKDILKTSLYRISNAKGCDVSVCCDPNDPTSSPDADFTNQFIQKFPKVMATYEGSKIVSIKLSTTADVKTNGWITPDTNMICKITKATISDTSDPTIKIATNLVQDCFVDQCNQAENITMDSLLQNSKSDMKYSFIDDARVTQSIIEGNISYVKEYIKKYKQINSALTNDDYNNRMIHIASSSKNSNILNMLIALKANLNVTNKLKETPIHFAVRSKNIDNINALLVQGVDLSIATNKGETPMFYAMLSGDIRIINMLYNNTSPLLNVDKLGNNLIHYCILNCPSFLNEDDDTKGISNSIVNSKADIIRFLIEHGVNSEQKNNSGITPLEMTSKQINREINRECSSNISKENSVIKDKFFDVKPTIQSNIENFKNNNSSKNNINNYTTEHKSLLEIQTILFNNIIRNNPDIYSGYVSTDVIPKGAPIEILDTVCTGSGMTGNEDSEDCIAKGGQLVKIKNKTTKIKLELTAQNDIDIENVNDSELYFKKNQKKIPKTNFPPIVKNYNTKYNNDVSSKISTIPNTTAGITYNIGQESSNVLNSTQTIMAFNPQPTNIPISQPTNNPAITLSNVNNPNKTKSILDHPQTYDENDTELRKCKSDALNNTIKITIAQTTNAQTTNAQTTNTQTTNAQRNAQTTNPQTTISQSTKPSTTLSNIKAVTSVFETYKTAFIVLFVLLGLIFFGIISYIFISNKNASGKNSN